VTLKRSGFSDSRAYQKADSDHVDPSRVDHVVPYPVKESGSVIRPPETTVTPSFVALDSNPGTFAKTSVSIRTQPTASGESVATGGGGVDVVTTPVSCGDGVGVAGVALTDGIGVSEARGEGDRAADEGEAATSVAEGAAGATDT